MICKVKTFCDVTEEWLEKATPNSHIVKDRLYFEYKGERYFVDNKNVVLDYSKKEKEVALWLEDTFGGEIFMLPRVNKPDGIMTADYLWNNEYWDLKEIKAVGKRVIDNRIKSYKYQSINYIIDVTGNPLDNIIILNQIKNIFVSKDRSWVHSIILKRNKELIKVFIKKD